MCAGNSVIHVAEEMPKCEVVDDGTGHKTADRGAT